MPNKQLDLQLLIARTLRWGVATAATIAAIGGIIYLVQHGSDPMPDYQTFSYDDPAFRPADYTTLDGILKGIVSMNSRSWVQMGVIVLILTPILRVVLSLFDFLRERDWLYSIITAIVLAVILCNSVGGF